MVEGAEQAAAYAAGAASGGPGDLVVVGVTPAGRAVAALRGAAAVADGQGEALGLRVEARAATQVQHDALPPSTRRRTAGTTPASQAIRREAPAEIGSPVSRCATPRPE